MSSPLANIQECLTVGCTLHHILLTLLRLICFKIGHMFKALPLKLVEAARSPTVVLFGSVSEFGKEGDKA